MVEYCKNAILLGGAHYQTAMDFFAAGDWYEEPKLAALLRHSLTQKFEIARLDPKEKGLGLMLEYGHTVGHALEWISQGRMLHGEAVYHGMQVAGLLANRMGILPDAELRNQSLLLQNLHCIPSIPAEISIGQILQAVQRDNKKTAKGLAFILMQGIGRVHREDPKQDSVLTAVPEAELAATLQAYCSQPI